MICCGWWIHRRPRAQNASQSCVSAGFIPENVWISCCVPRRCSGKRCLNSKFESLGEGWRKSLSGGYGVNCVLNRL